MHQLIGLTILALLSYRICNVLKNFVLLAIYLLLFWVHNNHRLCKSWKIRVKISKVNPLNPTGLETGLPEMHIYPKGRCTGPPSYHHYPAGLYTGQYYSGTQMVKINMQGKQGL